MEDALKLKGSQITTNKSIHWLGGGVKQVFGEFVAREPHRPCPSTGSGAVRLRREPGADWARTLVEPHAEVLSKGTGGEALGYARLPKSEIYS